MGGCENACRRGQQPRKAAEASTCSPRGTCTQAAAVAHHVVASVVHGVPLERCFGHLGGAHVGELQWRGLGRRGLWAKAFVDRQQAGGQAGERAGQARPAGRAERRGCARGGTHPAGLAPAPARWSCCLGQRCGSSGPRHTWRISAAEGRGDRGGVGRSRAGGCWQQQGRGGSRQLRAGVPCCFRWPSRACTQDTGHDRSKAALAAHTAAHQSQPMSTPASLTVCRPSSETGYVCWSKETDSTLPAESGPPGGGSSSC